MTPQSNSANKQTPHISPMTQYRAAQLQIISPLSKCYSYNMWGIKQAIAVLLFSFSASADLFFDPRDSIYTDELFLPREDTNLLNGVPGYGTNHGNAYSAQSDQNTGKYIIMYIYWFVQFISLFFCLGGTGTYSNSKPDLELVLLQKGSDK